MSDDAPGASVIILTGARAVAYKELMLDYNEWRELKLSGAPLTLTLEAYDRAGELLVGLGHVQLVLPNGERAEYGPAYRPGARIEREGGAG